MECMVLRRLTHHLHPNNLMPSEQFAFRKGHSTIDQILYLTQCVRDSQNHKPTRHTMAAFLDVSKAFDRVWKYKLLSKCFGVFGIKGKALPWISNFLNHQNFCVNFHATFSNSYKTNQGIPQGCVLSPTLFSLFISGVEKYVNPSQIRLFADDVVLQCSDTNISKMESQMNRSLVNIQEFADNHKMTFNASKSTVSLFTTNRHHYNYSPEIFLMSECLNYSEYPTYLGFTLDSEVNCGKHIEKIAYTARKRLKILKYLSGRDWGSDTSTLRITYTTLVHPVLEYGYQIFQVASPKNLKKLERVQLSALHPHSFNHVEFREELLTSTPKHSSHPKLDGRRSDTGRAEGGIFSNTPGNDIKISIRNPDHCSVFRSELIAISGALDHALNS
ncbi:probable RNA-directed DNA polymerase from transposon BS [Trichonephila clavipes]|nr:probable RNA-directed DNA polymerase from transposon BS [Trichonephila clavipes]